MNFRKLGTTFIVVTLACSVQAGSITLDEARDAQIDGIKRQLASGADLNERNSAGETRLHSLVSSSDEALVRLLLDEGADVNAKNRIGATPLSMADQLGHPSIVLLLKEHGARPVPPAPADRKRELVLEILRYSGPEKADKAALREKIKRDLDDRMRELLAQRLPLELLYLDVQIEVYERNFTETELADLAAFYATPAGGIAAAPGPRLLKEMVQSVANRFQPVLTAVAVQAAEEIKARYAGELAAAAEASVQESREETRRRERVKRIRDYLKTKSKDRQAWVNLGDLYFDGNQHREAIEAYTRALALQPDDPDVLTGRGVMYHRLGEAESAVRDFESAAAAPLYQNLVSYDMYLVHPEHALFPPGRFLAPEEIMPQGGALSECRLVHFWNAGSAPEHILF